MIDFLYTYGAFILVALALLSLLMGLVFCRAFLSAGSNPGDVAPKGAGDPLPDGGRAHE